MFYHHLFFYEELNNRYVMQNSLLGKNIISTNNVLWKYTRGLLVPANSFQANIS